MKSFQDRVVVITGAGSGMGRAYAQAFAALGSRLALNDYDEASLDGTIALLGSTPIVKGVFDVGDRVAMFQFAERVKEQLGNAHVIINNAGIEGCGKPVWATPAEAYDRIMRINFFGVVNGTQAFLPQLLARNEGAVVNISSIFGLVGPPNHADYAAAKFAVRGFTEALVVELRGTPITVHSVHPGGIATRIARAPGTQAFARKYLSTPPEAIVQQVIRAIQRGAPRVVYGNDAFRTWLGARFLPLKWLSALLWRDLAPVIDRSDYPPGQSAG